MRRDGLRRARSSGASSEAAAAAASTCAEQAGGHGISSLRCLRAASRTSVAPAATSASARPASARGRGRADPGRRSRQRDAEPEPRKTHASGGKAGWMRYAGSAFRGRARRGFLPHRGCRVDRLRCRRTGGRRRLDRRRGRGCGDLLRRLLRRPGRAWPEARRLDVRDLGRCGLGGLLRRRRRGRCRRGASGATASGGGSGAGGAAERHGPPNHEGQMQEPRLAPQPMHRGDATPLCDSCQCREPGGRAVAAHPVPFRRLGLLSLLSLGPVPDAELRGEAEGESGLRVVRLLADRLDARAVLVGVLMRAVQVGGRRARVDVIRLRDAARPCPSCRDPCRGCSCRSHSRRRASSRRGPCRRPRPAC